MWLMSLAWRALSVSWLVLLIAVRDSGVSLGASCRPCRLEVVSEGLLQVALAGDLAGLRDGDFREKRRIYPSLSQSHPDLQTGRPAESCPRGMVWRPPCTESPGLNRMASAPHDGGQGRRPGGCFGGEERGLAGGRTC